MLRSPRPIPRRYVRPVSRQTRALARKYHRPRRRYSWERLRRGTQRFSARLGAAWSKVLQSFWWLLGGALLGIVLITVFSPLFTVREIRISRRDQRVDVELVERALRPLFGKRMVFVGAQDVEPLLRADLPDAGRAAVPDVREVALQKTYPSTLVLTLQTAPLVAEIHVLAPDEAERSASGSALPLFLTDTGLLVAYPASQVPDTEHLLSIDVVDWGARPQPWSTTFDPEVLREIRTAETLLADQFGQGITRRVLYMRAQEFHLVLDDGLTLWLDRRSPVAEQLARYKLFLQVTPRGAAKRYVDLRLHDRIVYR